MKFERRRIHFIDDIFANVTVVVSFDTFCKLFWDVLIFVNCFFFNFQKMPGRGSWGPRAPSPATGLDIPFLMCSFLEHDKNIAKV